MKRVVWGAWLVLALLVLAACGQSPAAEAPAVEAPTAGISSKPEVTVYLSPT